MSASLATLGGRMLAESLMLSTCTITRVTGSTVDDATGLVTDTTATVYTGVCELKFPDTQSRYLSAGGQQLSDQQPVLKLPVGADSALVLPDDVAVITANQVDAAQVGVKVHIAGQHFKQFQTAYRFPVEAIS